MKKRLIAVLLICLMITSIEIPCLATSNDEVILVDASKEWLDMVSSTNRTFKNLPVTDWSEYDTLVIEMESKAATDDLITMAVYCEPLVPVPLNENNEMKSCYFRFQIKLDFVGIKEINVVIKRDTTVTLAPDISKVDRIYFTSTGWNATANTSENGVVFHSIKLKNTNTYTNNYDTSNINDETFNEMLSRAKRYYVGDTSLDTQNTYVKKSIKSVESSASSAWGKMNKSDDITVLFGDTFPVLTSEMRTQFETLEKMAEGYGTKGTTMYQNEQLRTDILFGLEWLYENLYGEDEINGVGWRTIWEFNWWDWGIGVPKSLLKTLAIMSDDVSDTDMEKYVSVVKRMIELKVPMLNVSDAGGRISNMTLAAILTRDTALLKKCNDDFNILNDPSQIDAEGEGNFASDNMYIAHGFAYTGGYGYSRLVRVSFAIRMTAGTTAQFNSSYDFETYSNAIPNTYATALWQGRTMRMLSGRQRVYNDEYIGTVDVVMGLLDLLGMYGDETDTNIREIIKGCLVDKVLDYCVTHVEIGNLAELLDIYNDNSIDAYDDSKNVGYVSYIGDRIIQKRNGYAIGIAMSSSRRGNYESINVQNTDGWYTGDGMVYMYTDYDKDQYGKAWRQDVNMYHMPGTTVDTQERDKVSIKLEQTWKSSQDFVGGVEFGDGYVTGAMFSESFHNDVEGTVVLDNGVTSSSAGGDLPIHSSSLVSQKSWFLFDNELVALGAGVNANDGYEVHTVVENRITDGNVYVDDELMSSSSYDKKEISNPDCAYIQDVGGYYFPDGGVLDITKTSSGFTEVWFNHGENPENDKYAYVLLPQYTKEQTNQYAQNPDIEIISNTKAIQSVRDKSAKAKGIVFWEEGQLEEVKAEQACIVMVGEDNGVYMISVSDPTQKLESGKIIIDRKLTEVDSLDDGVNVSAVGDTTVIDINFAKSGQTYKATFDISEEANEAIWVEGLNNDGYCCEFSENFEAYEVQKYISNLSEEWEKTNADAMFDIITDPTGSGRGKMFSFTDTSENALKKTGIEFSGEKNRYVKISVEIYGKSYRNIKMNMYNSTADTSCNIWNLISETELDIAGGAAYTLSKDFWRRWHTVTTYLDLQCKKSLVYLDGELVGMGTISISDIAEIEISTGLSNPLATTYMDNFNVSVLDKDEFIIGLENPVIVVRRGDGTVEASYEADNSNYILLLARYNKAGILKDLKIVENADKNTPTTISLESVGDNVKAFLWGGEGLMAHQCEPVN